MKKKIELLAAVFLSFLFVSCDEVLSVATKNGNGGKVIRNYVKMIGDTVYDDSVNMGSWENAYVFDGDDVDLDNLLFKIENKKEKLIVLGSSETAVELKFFDGGYKYTLFVEDEALKSFKF